MLYEARFITDRGDVFGSFAFEAKGDEAAKDHANRYLRTVVGKGHEIWKGRRLVHREKYF